MKVLLVGPYPPYMGGISVHLQRLTRCLRQAGDEVRVLDLHSPRSERRDDVVIALPDRAIARLFALLRVAASTSPDTLVHFHVAVLHKFKWLAPLLLLLFARNRKVITLHAGELTWETPGPLYRRYLAWLFGRFDRIVAVNGAIADFVAEKIGLPRERVRVIPAFIPQEPHADLIPAEVTALAGHKTLVVTSGDLQGNYRHETLIDCIELLDPARYAFIFAFYFDSPSEYEQSTLRRLAPLGNTLIYRNLSPEVYVSIVSACDIYVRTRITDGDSMAVREAEDFGLTVFAGDNVWRPPSCKLFPLDDADALMKLFDAYQRPAGAAARGSASSAIPPGARHLRDLYLDVARKSA